MHLFYQVVKVIKKKKKKPLFEKNTPKLDI
jgi:hypothetical protein